MTLSTAELDSLRFHLGYGNINVGAYPLTPEGFYELFYNVISPNLSTNTETTSTTAVTAATTTAITLGSVSNIAVNTRLVVDVGDLAEIVTVKSISGSAVTCYFANAHPASGYPVAVMSGLTRLRLLVHSADKAWSTMQSASVTSSAGIKQLGNGEIEWFPGGAVYRQVLEHYNGIVSQIARLVRVGESGGAGGSMELY